MPFDSAPARKRQYQPTLDSFFARNEVRSISNSSIAPEYQPLGAPVLPEAVQSSLLSVGMRVRKAVPEGYKTHKSALFADTTVPFSGANRQALAIKSKATELTPFCGLHKIGGLSVQTLPVPTQLQPPSHRYNDDLPTELFSGSFEENLGSLSSSQESIMHESDVPDVRSGAGKRRLEEDADRQDDLYIDNTMTFPLFSSSSFGLGIVGFGQPIHNSSTPPRQRAIAKPRSKAKAKGTALIENICDNDQPMDFGEASFLHQENSAEIMEDMGYV